MWQSILFLALSVVLAADPVSVPQLRGTDLVTGTSIQISPQPAQNLVVVFVSAKCPCSDSHVHELNELVEKNPRELFVGIHANADETEAQMKEYLSHVKAKFPILRDQNHQWADSLKAFKTPHAYVFANGELVYRGGVTNSADCQKADRFYLREALADLHAGRKVKTAETRTLGCVISRGEKNVW